MTAASALRAGGPGWLAAYVLVTFLAQPQPLGATVVDLGWLLGWLSPACLLIGLAGRSPASAARAGFLATWLAHALILHWIYVVTVVYGHAPALLGVLAPMALAAYMGLHGGLFGAIWGWLARRGAAGPASAALLWVVVDHLRSFLFTGFPWAELGYAQHANPPLMALAAWTGVYGPAWVTALGGAALAAWAVSRLRGEPVARRRLAAVAGLVVALHGVGGLDLAWRPRHDAPTLRVAALQGNVEQDRKWSPEAQSETLDRYEALARRAAARGARLVVWPETAVPGPIELDPELSARLAALARETRAAQVVGAVGIRVDREGGRIDRFYDSAFVIDAEGRWIARYDKSHLVPFGEYVPLRGVFGALFQAVARGIAPLDVSAGPGPRSVEIALEIDGEGSATPVRLGIPICYELLFPDLVRRFVAGGAQVLVAITNDAWYGRTGAPHQFMAMTAVRSAETGVFTVRAANTGVSAIVDDRGRVLEDTAVFEEALLVGDVPLEGLRGPTPYARHGDVFAAACWVGLGVTAAVAARRRRRTTRDGARA